MALPSSSCSLGSSIGPRGPDVCCAAPGPAETHRMHLHLTEDNGELPCCDLLFPTNSPSPAMCRLSFAEVICQFWPHTLCSTLCNVLSPRRALQVSQPTGAHHRDFQLLHIMPGSRRCCLTLSHPLLPHLLAPANAKPGYTSAVQIAACPAA